MNAEIPFDELKIGQTASTTRTFTEKDVRESNRLLGDSNPIHNDLAFAKKTIFRETIVPGALLIALLSDLASSKLPGSGYVYMKQKVRFLKPVKAGDTITATIECIEKIGKKRIAVFSTEFRNQFGETVLVETSTDKFIG
ncbi:MAG: MaoC family dehydratase [Candidatus Diapherotrites archaeon]